MTAMAPTPGQWRRRLGELLRPLDVESGLLYCNHVLAAYRDEECAPSVQTMRHEIGPPCLPFIVHLAAREILRHGLGPTGRGMDAGEFKQLVWLLWEMLDQDPAMQDPDWSASDPTGWLVRMMGLQQKVIDIHLQNYGLSAALFTNALPRSSDERVDVPARVREILRMPPELFMRIGFIAGSVRIASHKGMKLRGTITSKCLEEWESQLGKDVSESWPRFCELVSLAAPEFRHRCMVESRETADSRLDLYRLNLLRKCPLIETAEGRFVAPDPELVLARTTLGVYYDALAASGTEFTQAFGPRFSNLVGDLLRGGCGDGRVWSESHVAQGVRCTPPSRNADHAILGGEAHILIECKALRPSAQLLMLGDQRDVDGIVERIVGAVDQLASHAQAVREGKWASLGLSAKDSFGIVVTYGEIPSVHGTLFRSRIEERAKARGRMSLPYRVLSLSELDSFLRLVELGHEPHVVMRAMCGPQSGAAEAAYRGELSSDAISSRTRARGQSVLESLRQSDGSAVR